MWNALDRHGTTGSVPRTDGVMRYLSPHTHNAHNNHKDRAFLSDVPSGSDLDNSSDPVPF